MTGTMRAPRSRGGLSGTLLVLLGLWGGLLPFVGPYFDFGFAPDDPWVYDTDRLQLTIAPAVAVVLGGLILLAAANRVFAVFGAWLAALGGAWFAVGSSIATLWDVPGIGAPLGSGETQRVAEHVAGFTGLGVAIAFLAGLALGRFAVIGAREKMTMDGHGPAESNTTRPLVYGRYARENVPPAKEPSHGDRRIAGETRFDG
ncbi:hypothetical protein BZB76_2907 [Actinomadura pelletieri DSM 43383]|uniref:Uncharacterized protein n=1 Tax=Actinomadura pelletieri DSM 43383 TaxID=1120940 RepID=A0A495QN50_9ACTN|nr:hypothetical protein [Actinomadura pelletieri]RKS74394.1 hypothetical protein BZB76_2907 [Actinomadura pelletieri DSM 43383]